MFLPYVKNHTDRIGRIMKKHKLNLIDKPTTKLKDILRSVKDSRDPLSTAGVYRIPCTCWEVYIGTSNAKDERR